MILSHLHHMTLGVSFQLEPGVVSQKAKKSKGWADAHLCPSKQRQCMTLLYLKFPRTTSPRVTLSHISLSILVTLLILQYSYVFASHLAH